MSMKIVRGLFIILLSIALIGCTAGTSETTDATQPDEEEQMETQGGELRVAYLAQPPVLDPHVSTVIATSDVTMGLIFETLVTVDSAYNTQPMLAESYEQSDDGKTITFHLREDVLFHNGQEMVADDVVASMNRWKEGLGARGQFTDATFEAKDDYTVVLNLPEPLSIALDTLAFGGAAYAAIMPKELIENAGDTGVDEFVGTGPFQFVEWKQDQHIHLTRFEEYQPLSEPADGLAGKKEALVDDIYFVFTPDSTTQVAGIQSGEFDMVWQIPYDNAEQLESDPNIEIKPFPAATMHVHFNKKEGIFADVKARQAVATALDMEEILTAAFSNEEYFTLNHNMMMPHLEEQWYSDVGKDKYNQNDPEKAKQLLNEAGYNGEELTLITDRDYQEHYDASVVVQEQLQQIGMNVNLEAYDWATVSSLREDKSAYDMFVMGNVVVPEPTSTAYLMKDYAGWTDSPEVDKLIDELRSKTSVDDAKEVYDELQEWYWEYMPAVKIGDYSVLNAFRTTVENVQYNNRPILWNVSNK